MSALNLLQTACLKKSYKSFKDLPVGSYFIKSFSLADTDHGKRVRIEIEDTFMFLPERFASSLDEAAIKELNSTPKIMIYSGKDAAVQNRLILDFQEVAYYTDELLSQNDM